ncbi:MAG TPA: coproporphyrinogen III oxidase [Alistipes sp.]|nr:coproporphyrinogen III oxidase [Alistipes sp.]
MAGIYLHIPFCKTRCIYCDFYSTTRSELKARYIQALCQELEMRKAYLKGERIETVYFGGGTPSLLPAAAVASLLRLTEELWECPDAEETTLEANPDDLDEGYLAALREAGVDRLSIGVQSFDDGCLKLMNRRHTAAGAERAVRAAQRAGFANLTVDLIFGVPGYGGDSLRRSLDRVLALDVQHVSAYHLTVEPATAFGRLAERGRFAQVDDETSEREFLEVHEALSGAGFEHYEVSNYARPGFRARHNASYWRGDKYIGLGPAAHSFDGTDRSWNVSSVGEYLAGAEPGRERLTGRDRFNEYLLTRLRTAEGIDLDLIARSFGAARAARTERLAAPMLRSGVLAADGRRLSVPPRRMLVSDAVVGALFEVEEDV